MRKINDFENVKENSGDFERPAAGGYVGVILGATDVPEKEYIKLDLDIAEGDFANYSVETMERAGFCPLHAIRSYKDKALGFFKAFTNAVEACNPNYKWDWNEEALEGKKICFVLGEEEYQKQDGTVGERYTIDKFLSVEDLKAGKFKVPAKKKLAVAVPVETNDDDDDLPWV